MQFLKKEKNIFSRKTRAALRAAFSPDPAQEAAVREMLFTQLRAKQQALYGSGNSRLSFGFSFSAFRLALGVCGLLLVLATGMSALAQSALPGDTLYKMKLARERLERLLARTPIAQASYEAKITQRRVAEVRQSFAAAPDDTSTATRSKEKGTEAVKLVEKQVKRLGAVRKALQNDPSTIRSPKELAQKLAELSAVHTKSLVALADISTPENEELHAFLHEEVASKIDEASTTPIPGTVSAVATAKTALEEGRFRAALGQIELIETTPVPLAYQVDSNPEPLATSEQAASIDSNQPIKVSDTDTGPIIQVEPNEEKKPPVKRVEIPQYKVSIGE